MVKPAALALAAVSVSVSGFELGRRLYRDSRLFTPDPEPAISWDPVDYGLAPDAVDEVEFEVDGNELRGWYCRAAHPIASALYCHGNSANFTLDLPVIRSFVDAGISVLTFDYRGFGRSTGRPTLRGVYRDAFAAAAIHDDLRPAGLPSILYGFSLGGAIAAKLALRVRFDALVLQSTFTCLRDIVRTLHPEIPLHLLCAGELDTMQAMERIALPALVIHGTDDEVIPRAMGKALFEKAKNGRAYLAIEGAAHGNVFDVGGDQVVRAIRSLALDLGPALEAARIAS